jgi:aspartyl aminopeptidase
MIPYVPFSSARHLAPPESKTIPPDLLSFPVRNANSQTCGSTVGPHLSTHVRTVDIGLAQLSMHSIRETGGAADVRPYIDLFKTFFEGFAEIERDLRVD